MTLGPAVLLVAGAAVAVRILVGVVWPRLFPKSQASQILQALEAARAERHADFNVIRSFHDHVASTAMGDALNDRTWEDLNLDEIFLTLDRATSEPGRQYLYHLLRTPRSSVEPLVALERTVGACAADHALPDTIRSSLRRLGDRRSGFLVELFFGELPPRPKLWWLFPLLTATSLTCLAIAPLVPRALIVWVGVCVVNVAVQVIYKPRVKRFIPAIHELPNFLGAAEALGALDRPECADQAECLRTGARRLGTLRRATSWLMFEPDQSNELVSSIYEYVNLLFLFDVNAFVLAMETIRGEQAALRKMFEALGSLDASQAIAAWRSALPRWTRPHFIEREKSCAVEGVIHPLVDDAVPNSLVVAQTGLLISGSNMSGKTTFVRALGVNAVLAQTVNTACASRWSAPLVRVRTFIGRADSIMEGKSYYLAEAEAVLLLIQAKEDGHQHLFLLDEIFRGTNTTERIAAAAAVLAYLNRADDLVVVATHDLEVLDLLHGTYTPQHFTEQIDESGLTFDYRIRPGPSSTRNAIALLKFMNYPDDVLAEAVANLDWQGRGGAWSG